MNDLNIVIPGTLRLWRNGTGGRVAILYNERNEPIQIGDVIAGALNLHGNADEEIDVGKVEVTVRLSEWRRFEESKRTPQGGA